VHHRVNRVCVTRRTWSIDAMMVPLSVVLAVATTATGLGGVNVSQLGSGDPPFEQRRYGWECGGSVLFVRFS
jgi:hypothetical protein